MKEVVKPLNFVIATERAHFSEQPNTCLSDDRLGLNGAEMQLMEQYLQAFCRTHDILVSPYIQCTLCYKFILRCQCSAHPRFDTLLMHQ